MVRNKKMVLTALFIALGLTLPMMTANVPMIGNMLLPMHFPIIICGLICGAGYGALAGFITPLLRSFIFSMPPLFPIATAMTFELATYGAVAGLVYVVVQKSKGSAYPALIGAMLSGRVDGWQRTYASDVYSRCFYQCNPGYNWTVNHNSCNYVLSCKT